MGSLTIPTKIRIMNLAEYKIVESVFGNTLPWRQRIFITNGLGLGGAPFAIPTSLIATIQAIPAGWLGVAVGYLASAINAGYIINVGSSYSTLSSSDKNLLVHETAHVWQGKNSLFSQDFVFNSCLNQCWSGSGAYHYSAGNPWSSYNVEQQARIVEDWYAAGMPQSGPLWTYIDKHVRKGDA